MTMGKKAGGTLIGTLAMTAAVVALSAAPALASTTLHITVKGAGTFTAKAGKTVLADGLVKVTCASSSAASNIPNGTKTGVAPVKVGTASKLAFNNCTGPTGAVHNKVNSEPYAVRIDSKTNSKGQTAGIITGINVHVTTTGCAFDVTGSAPGYYTNGKHTLTMTPHPPVKLLNKAQLTVKNVSGCLGIVHNGDHPTFTATYTLSKKGTIISK